MAFHLPWGQSADHLFLCRAVSLQKEIPLEMEKVNVFVRYIFSYVHDSCVKEEGKHLQE